MTITQSTSPTDRKRLGAYVEQQVSLHLQKQRLRLLAKNFSTKRGEIDLIFLDPTNTVVFVEVRYRQHTRFGSGADSVVLAKQKKIIYAARCYLQQHPGYGAFACRFDVVSVTAKDAKHGMEPVLDIEWIQHAFSAF